MTIEKGTPFMIVNAFTQDAFAGNPAAVLLLDKHIPTETSQKIAQNFNQPATAFVTPTIRSISDDDSVASFDISWFTCSGAPLPLCGHGTLAAAKAVFAYPGLVDSSQIKTINFRTKSGVVINTSRSEDDEEWFEIKLPAAQLDPLSRDDVERLTGIIRRATGRDDLNIKFLASGSGAFYRSLLIELDEKDCLKDIKFQPRILLETGYRSNIFTTNSSSGNEVYLTRMFAPEVGVDEDHVCASANCLMAPYWAKKKAQTAEMRVRQVGARGGELRVAPQEDVVRLKGQVRVIAKGEMYL